MLWRCFNSNPTEMPPTPRLSLTGLTEGAGKSVPKPFWRPRGPRFRKRGGDGSGIGGSGGVVKEGMGGLLSARIHSAGRATRPFSASYNSNQYSANSINDTVGRVGNGTLRRFRRAGGAGAARLES
jgi:hypothetical protein